MPDVKTITKEEKDTKVTDTYFECFLLIITPLSYFFNITDIILINSTSSKLTIRFPLGDNLASCHQLHLRTSVTARRL